MFAEECITAICYAISLVCTSVLSQLEYKERSPECPYEKQCEFYLVSLFSSGFICCIGGVLLLGKGYMTPIITVICLCVMVQVTCAFLQCIRRDHLMRTHRSLEKLKTKYGIVDTSLYTLLVKYEVYGLPFESLEKDLGLTYEQKKMAIIEDALIREKMTALIKVRLIDVFKQAEMYNDVKTKLLVLKTSY